MGQRHTEALVIDLSRASDVTDVNGIGDLVDRMVGGNSSNK
jgi:hypothetical protein